MLFPLTIAHAGSRANWKSVSIVTYELSKPVKITLSEKHDLLSELKVEITGKKFSVPKRDLVGTKRPQLETLYVGYWDDETLTFYIALKCGLLSSFPHVPLPQVNFYIFQNGAYSHRETYDAINDPNLDLDLYRLANRN